MNRAIALREWAVAVKALEEGRQVIVLRKGGIAEETKEFRLESPQFFLFPSFEHQKPHLIKTEERASLAETQAEASDQADIVRISSFAEVAADFEVTDANTLQRLADLHIWTEDYAEERLKWKKTKPLHVLVLRTYKLTEPVEIPLLERYGGCKSWIELERFVPGGMTPVLSEEQFRERVEMIKKRIDG